MSNSRLEPLAALGMIVTETMAIAISGIIKVVSIDDGFDITLVNGEVISLRHSDAEIFEKQVTELSLFLRRKASGLVM